MGLIRLLLAALVIAAHSGGNINHNFGGPAAVLLFYVASGFYMAMVLTTKYQGAGAARRFYASRYSRLWLPYIVVTALVLLDRALTGDLQSWITSLQAAPWWLAVVAVFANLFIFGQDLFWLIAFDAQGMRWAPQLMTGDHNGTQLLLNLPMFTVAIELYFYLLAPWVLVRFERVLAFAALGAIWVVTMSLTKQANIATMYYLFPAAMFYFGLGAVVWWVSQTEQLRGWRYFAVVGVLLAALGAKHIAPGPMIALFCLAVPTAFKITRHSRFDRFLGDLSYPLYLVHWPVIHLIRPYFPGDGNEYAVYLASMLAGLAASGLILLLVDRPLTRWRERFATPVTT